MIPNVSSVDRDITAYTEVLGFFSISSNRRYRFATLGFVTHHPFLLQSSVRRIIAEGIAGITQKYHCLKRLHISVVAPVKLHVSWNAKKRL